MKPDRMLDMGFVHEVKRIIGRLPRKRQTLFFSATMPPAIQSLVREILTNPVAITVTPEIDDGRIGGPEIILCSEK